MENVKAAILNKLSIRSEGEANRGDEDDIGSKVCCVTQSSVLDEREKKV